MAPPSAAQSSPVSDAEPSASQPPIRPDVVYSVDSSIELRPARESMTAAPIVVKIIRHLRVDVDRVSQVVVAKLLQGALGIREQPLTNEGLIVAKFFDPAYAKSDSPGAGPQECLSHKDKEVKCYNQMTHLLFLRRIRIRTSVRKDHLPAPFSIHRRSCLN